MPKISLIVPVYKAEKYLRRCIDSIIAQTFTDWECILVDDGSPDGSGAICDEYVAKDARIQVIHKENGGVSSARNIGIEQAGGEWVTFIDSDDWISQYYLESFVCRLEYGDRTIYLQGIQMFTIHKGLSPMFSYEDNFYSIKEHVDLFVNNRILADGCPVAKLFNLNVLKNNNIRFNETISINEDHIFVLTYYNYVDNVCTISELSYKYYYDFTVPSLTKINRTYGELHRVSSLMYAAYNMICSRLRMTKEEQSVLSPMFGPNQAVKALLSCMSNKEPLSSFCLCEKYLSENFGYVIDNYDASYKIYLWILSLNVGIRIKYSIFKAAYLYNDINSRVKARIRFILWHRNIKLNKL